MPDFERYHLSRANSPKATAGPGFAWMYSIRQVTISLAVIALGFYSICANAAELVLRDTSVQENGQSVSVSIALSQAMNSAVRVRFATSADTAKPREDFYGVYTVVTFSPGETLKRIPIVILNDTELEDEERLGTRIWDAEGDGVSIRRAAASVRIIDDDSGDTPTVSVDDVTVDESAESVVVDIRLSGPASDVVSMVYATTAATATLGQDFYGTSGSLRFAPGQVKKSVKVTLLDDNLDESDEFFEINLHNVIGATKGSTQAAITLVDDDGGRTSFTCLDADSIENVDATWYGQTLTGRIRPGRVADNTAIDLRGTHIAVHESADDAVDANHDPVIDSRWGLVQIDTSTNLCIAGGEVTSPNPYNITWLENYDTEGIGRGYRLGTTRNHTAVDTADSVRPTVSGIYFFNLHDGPRFNGSKDWRLENSWGEYTRDDCIENDEIASGYIFDSLFDGCYAGYSNRSTRDFDDNGNRITGIGDTVTFERVLLRMEMMPGPHKACERTHLYYDSDRNPYDEPLCVERDVYGTGNLFKLVDQDDPSGSINPMFRLIDSVFVVEQLPNRTNERRGDFPPANKIAECRNVTVIYLGSGTYPGRLPPEGCFTLLTGEEGKSFWRDAVTDSLRVNIRLDTEALKSKY